MENERARANGPAISRRTILTALPASGVALTLPASASQATHETPVMRRFRQWEQIRSDWHGGSQEECDRDSDRMIALEEQMIELPSENIADLAAKIVAYSCWGDFGLPGLESKLWTEMEELIAAASGQAVPPRRL